MIHQSNLDTVEVRAAILVTLGCYDKGAVVSTNHVIGIVRDSCPECAMHDHTLAREIQQEALSLGLIPVFDPLRSSSRSS